MKRYQLSLPSALLAAGVLAGCVLDEPPETFSSEPGALKLNERFALGYNVHLTEELHFEQIDPTSNVDQGRKLFGVAADLQNEDPAEALFEGFSIAAGRVIESNGRTCFTCHRGDDVNFGLPAPPLSDSIPPDDPLFTGIDADAGGDPDAMENLDRHGLIKYQPNRFNQARAHDSPFRQVFFWRKSPSLLNVAFHRGLLNDGRGRAMLETDRGAIFSHTQPSDDRFDDLFSGQDARDLQAFQFSLVTDPLLFALRDPDHPQHEALVEDPFYTVPVETAAQERGQKVFERDCMSCHSTPNVFNHRASVEALGHDGLGPEFPVYAPHISRTFNVGVAERNAQGLRFTRHVGDGEFEPIVIPLANEDGSTKWHTVTTDIGMAATTGRSVDIGRFRVPQLRNIRNLGPYFHDNSAATLEEVIEYFNSTEYNWSADGRYYRIRQTDKEKADLLEFLKIL